MWQYSHQLPALPPNPKAWHYDLKTLTPELLLQTLEAERLRWACQGVSWMYQGLQLQTSFRYLTLIVLAWTSQLCLSCGPRPLLPNVIGTTTGHPACSLRL